MNINLKKNWLSFFIYGVCFINLFLLAFTFYRAEIASKISIFKYLSFSLAGENNFAAWWSGMLFLLTGLHAFDGYFRLKNTEPKAAIGWGLLSIIFFILSLDEIGSIHERVDGQLGSLYLLPFAIVLLAILVYALFYMRTAKGEVIRTWPIIIGFCILGSVAFQEKLEHYINWSFAMKRFRVIVEEGTELLGITILLKVCMANSQGLFNRNNSRIAPALDAISFFRTYILVIAIILAPVFAYITAGLPDQGRGHPSDWFASMLFFIAAGALFKNVIENNKTTVLHNWGLIILCLFASSISVSIQPIHKILHITFHGITWEIYSFRILILFITTMIIHAIFLLKDNFLIRQLLLFLLILGNFAFFFFVKFNLFTIYLLTQYLGLVTYYSISIQAEQNIVSIHEKTLKKST